MGVEDNKKWTHGVSCDAVSRHAHAADETILSNTLVIIPARDEGHDIRDVVERVKSQGFDVLVVDDHSSDNTSEVAAKAGARVIGLAFHAGAWAAMQTGIRVAQKDGYRFALTLDGDGQHRPEDIPLLLSEYGQSKTLVNVVIGACVARGNWRRRMAWWLLRALSGVQVDDMTSGFRLYDHAAITALSSADCNLLEYQDVGVLMHLHRHGLKFHEVEVQMSQRMSGHSRIFSTWTMVSRYLIYSLLLILTRRRYRRPWFNKECAS